MVNEGPLEDRSWIFLSTFSAVLLFDNLQEDSEQKRGPCLLWEPL